MATINFLYRSNKSEAKLIIRLLFRISDLPSKILNKNTKELVEYSYTDFVFAENTKISVSKEYWNKYHKAQRISDVDILNTKTEINTKINCIETFLLKEFEKHSPTEINKKWLTTKIDNFYNPKKNELIPTDLVSFFDYYLNYRRNELNPPSVMKYKTIQLKLKEFQIYRNRTILISDVTEIFMNEFIDYYKSKNYAHNTAQREFSFIKTVCLKAKFLGLEVSHQMEHLTIKAKEVKSIHLTFEELDKIDSTEFKSINNKEIKCTASELETAKDWLIISANCGARVSDYMRFTIDMINTKEGAENSTKKYIDFIQKKTEGKMSIPLNDKIIEILDKRGFNFPDRITDQRYNILLKEVCKQAEINAIVEGGLLIDNRKVYGKYPKYKLVSSHIGRRSFASNNYGKIPTSYLTYMTGHSSELQFRKYLGKTNDDIATEVAKYF